MMPGLVRAGMKQGSASKPASRRCDPRSAPGCEHEAVSVQRQTDPETAGCRFGKCGSHDVPLCFEGAYRHTLANCPLPKIVRLLYEIT